MVALQGWGKGDRRLEACFVVVGACNIAAPEEDEVLVGERTILDIVGGGVVEGNGKVAKIGGHSCRDGVVWDGEED